MLKNVLTVVALALALAGGAATTNAAEINGDLRISEDTVLTEDTAVSGSLVVNAGATLDLNGHDLKVSGIRGVTVYKDSTGAEYERLEYIESDGTQYIITDFTPSAGDRAEIEIAFTADGDNYSGIFSTRDKDGNNGFSLWRTGSNGTKSFAYAIRADYGTYGSERFLKDLGDNLKASAGIRRIVMHSGYPGNGKYAVVLKDRNDNDIKNDFNIPAGTYSPAGPLVLMTNGKWMGDGIFTPGDGFNAKLRFYYLKFDADGAKCTIYPVRRVSDGRIGVFNTVTKTFLPPETGTFTVFGEYAQGGTVKDAFTQGARDLTVADASRVTQVGTLYTADYSISNLFNDNYTHPNVTGDHWNDHRILAWKKELPIKADYDFGEGKEQVVDAYRLYFDQKTDYTGRAPKAWKFFGSNDEAAKGGDDSLWTLLDERSNETSWSSSEERVYSFLNDTPYRFYRISFEAENGKDELLELIQLEYFRMARLCIDVPEGETVKNVGVTLKGDFLVVKDGDGTLEMSKPVPELGSGKTYAGANRGDNRLTMLVRKGYVRQTVANACGQKYAHIRVLPGGQFDVNGETSPHYDYEIAGRGPEGAEVPGALVNNTAVNDVWDNKSLMRNIYLKGDATVGGSQNIALYRNGSAFVHLNGHTLSFEMATPDRMIYSTGKGYAGPGEIAVVKGRFRPVLSDIPVTGDVSLRILNGGVFDAQNKSLSAPLKEFTFAAGAKYQHGWADPYTVTVLDKYAPNPDNAVYDAASTKDVSPWVRLGAPGSLTPVLDLSLFSTVADGSHLSFFDGSTVKVYTGARELAVGERLVSWSSEPPDSVTFALECDGASAEDRKLETVVMSDGLYLKDGAVPAYAIRNVEENVWEYYRKDGTRYEGDWSGTFRDIEVRFSTFAQYEAIKELGVSPLRFRMTSLDLQQGDAVFDMSSGMDFAVSEGISIDLKGNTLKLPASGIGGSKAFTVTNSTEASGTLVIDVPADSILRNGNVQISGSVRVLKTGQGTFEASKGSQTYTGGTEILEGIVKCGMRGSDRPLGSVAGAVTVAENGILEMDGYVSFEEYQFILAGGVLQNSTSPRESTDRLDWNAYWGKVKLTADSTINVFETYGFITMNFLATYLDLGGYELTVKIGAGRDMYLFGTQISNGVLNVASGGWIRFGYGSNKKDSGVNAETADIIMHAAFRAVYGDIPVRNYTADFNADYNQGDVALNVYGVFKPASHDLFYGCTMQDGSTIDLTRRTSALSVKSAFTGGRNTMSFAGGKVTVKIDPSSPWIRELANSSGRLLDWSAGVAPGDDVHFVLDDGCNGLRYRIVPSADGKGLDLQRIPGLTITVR